MYVEQHVQKPAIIICLGLNHGLHIVLSCYMTLLWVQVKLYSWNSSTHIYEWKKMGTFSNSSSSSLFPICCQEREEGRLCGMDEAGILLLIYHTFLYFFWLFGSSKRGIVTACILAQIVTMDSFTIQVLLFSSDALCGLVCLPSPS